MFFPQQITDFQAYIFTWWEKNRRDLPWRHTNDPYSILVSELMLQQTQVARVIPKYTEFLVRFPTVNVLSKASTGDVLILWKGLGYNRRAIYLKKLSEIVMTSYRGIFPEDEEKLLALPGLGLYTARAVLVFAFKRDVAMVDTNIRQIIVRHFFDGIPQPERTIQTAANQLVPLGKSWEWHQALMDYGSLALPRTPHKKVNTTKKHIPFEETHRFIRGKILDFVRDKDWNEEHLIDIVVSTYEKPRSRVIYNLENLEKEGLVEKHEDTIRLPS